MTQRDAIVTTVEHMVDIIGTTAKALEMFGKREESLVAKGIHDALVQKHEAIVEQVEKKLQA